MEYGMRFRCAFLVVACALVSEQEAKGMRAGAMRRLLRPMVMGSAVPAAVVTAHNSPATVDIKDSLRSLNLYKDTLIPNNTQCNEWTTKVFYGGLLLSSAWLACYALAECIEAPFLAVLFLTPPIMGSYLLFCAGANYFYFANPKLRVSMDPNNYQRPNNFFNRLTGPNGSALRDIELYKGLPKEYPVDDELRKLCARMSADGSTASLTTVLVALEKDAWMRELISNGDTAMEEHLDKLYAISAGEIEAYSPCMSDVSKKRLL